MQRKFQNGDDIAHRADKSHRMTVVGYTNDGKVIGRWKEKTGFKSEQLLEPELEKWVDTPVLGFGQMEGHDIDKDKR